MTPKKSRLATNFFSLGIVQAVTSLLQLVVVPYVIARVGVDRFGVIAVAQVVMFYLSTFTEYGFNQTATRDIVLYKTDRRRVSAIFFRVFFSRLILCIIAFVFLVILVVVVPVFRVHALLYVMAFVFVIGQSFLANWFFQGLEHMQFIALVGLTGRILFAALVFLFIKDRGDDIFFLFFLGTGNLVAAGISIFTAWRVFRLQFIRPSAADIAGELRQGWQIMLTNLSINTCQYANIFILRLFTNDLVTGYYSIAERIFFTLKQGLAIFSQVAYPRVCRLLQNGGTQLVSFFKRFYVPFLACVTGIAILLFIFSLPVLSFFIGHEYAGTVFALRMFCIILVIACLNIPATLALLAGNHKKSYFKIYTLGTVLNILSNIVLVYFFSVTGTITAIFVTETFIATGVIWEVYRLNRASKKQFIPGGIDT
jgi:polysaccharide transporter, PST family